MSAGEVAVIRPVTPMPDRVGQATAVEMQRAVAQVQAAVVVAQERRRNVSQAIEDMRETCKRKELADRAFFRYSRGGNAITGASIHLARELARIWGNIEYGLLEMRRDDDAGQSEMQAFAWDLQTNTRNSSVFINPHKLYTGGKNLSELRDIYENNANVGARRVREAIFAVLPAWFVEEAKDLCNKTIKDGGGVPLPVRIANAIEVFGNLGISTPQLERKIGRTSDRWDDQDVAQLRIIRQSLQRGEISKDEEFPAEPTSAADIIASAKQEAKPQPEPAGPAQNGGTASPEPAAPRPPALATTGQQRQIEQHRQRLGFEDHEGAEWLGYLVMLAGIDTSDCAPHEWPISGAADLTQEQAKKVQGLLDPKMCPDRSALVQVALGTDHTAQGQATLGEGQ